MINTKQAAIPMMVFAVVALGVFSMTSASASMTPVQNPTNGHYYELVLDSDITGIDARIAAASMTFDGLNGHLVTITDAEENAFVAGLSSGNHRSFIGLTDDVVEGEFLWITGEPLVYTNWQPGEPNDFRTGEDYVELFSSTGQWNDIWNINPWGTGYIVEYEAAEKNNPCDALEKAENNGNGKHKGISKAKANNGC